MTVYIRTEEVNTKKIQAKLFFHAKQTAWLTVSVAQASTPA